MKIQRILVASKMYQELEQIIKTTEIFTEKDWRFRSEENVYDEDYEWADAFVAFRRPANFQFKNIKWVHSLGAGVDKILKDIKWNESVLLTRMIGPFGQKMSEYCLSYLLQEYQKHHQFEDLQAEKQWKVIAPTSLKGKKVVIFGTGAIGEEIAKTLTFFQMDVYGVSFSGRANPHFHQVFTSGVEHQHFLQEADAIINTMPLTNDTRSFFNEELFSFLYDVIFINVGRGESVDNTALLHALDRGNIQRAILDVFHEEPLPNSDPLWLHPKVTITPHISALTAPAEGVDCFLKTMEQLEKGSELINKVDLKKGY